MLPVTAIIPTYNRAPSIERAVRSALAAIVPGDEVVVVDDGSRDDTEKVLKPYGHLIRYTRSDNRGAGAARNCGVAEARTPLVAFLDSDDEWLPWRIQVARNLLQGHPEVLFCFSNFRAEYGNRIVHNGLRFWPGMPEWGELFDRGVLYSSLAKLPAGWEDFQCHIGSFYSALLTGGGVCTITLTVRREEAGLALHFPENVPTYEDWWCYAQLAQRGLGAYLHCETAIQHDHRGPRLTDADSLTSATTRLFMMEQVWGQDGGFLETHQALYERMRSEQRLKRLKGLLRHGMVRQARIELSGLENVPTACRLLAQLPGPLLAVLLGVRERLYFARRRLAENVGQGPG